MTQRDLEAVAQQAAEELLKKSSSGGFWPFKEEERQLVRAGPGLGGTSGLVGDPWWRVTANLGAVQAVTALLFSAPCSRSLSLGRMHNSLLHPHLGARRCSCSRR